MHETYSHQLIPYSINSEIEDKISSLKKMPKRMDYSSSSGKNSSNASASGTVNTSIENIDWRKQGKAMFDLGKCDIFACVYNRAILNFTKNQISEIEEKVMQLPKFEQFFSSINMTEYNIFASNMDSVFNKLDQKYSWVAFLFLFYVKKSKPLLYSEILRKMVSYLTKHLKPNANEPHVLMHAIRFTLVSQTNDYQSEAEERHSERSLRNTSVTEQEIAVAQIIMDNENEDAIEMGGGDMTGDLDDEANEAEADAEVDEANHEEVETYSPQQNLSPAQKERISRSVMLYRGRGKNISIGKNQAMLQDGTRNTSDDDDDQDDDDEDDRQSVQSNRSRKNTSGGGGANTSVRGGSISGRSGIVDIGGPIAHSTSIRNGSGGNGTIGGSGGGGGGGANSINNDSNCKKGSETSSDEENLPLVNSKRKKPTKRKLIDDDPIFKVPKQSSSSSAPKRGRKSSAASVVSDSDFSCSELNGERNYLMSLTKSILKPEESRKMKMNVKVLTCDTDIDLGLNLISSRDIIFSKDIYLMGEGNNILTFDIVTQPLFCEVVFETTLQLQSEIFHCDNVDFVKKNGIICAGGLEKMMVEELRKILVRRYSKTFKMLSSYEDLDADDKKVVKYFSNLENMFTPGWPEKAIILAHGQVHSISMLKMWSTVSAVIDSLNRIKTLVARNYLETCYLGEKFNRTMFTEFNTVLKSICRNETLIQAMIKVSDLFTFVVFGLLLQIGENNIYSGILFTSIHALQGKVTTADVRNTCCHSPFVLPLFEILNLDNSFFPDNTKVESKRKFSLDDIFNQLSKINSSNNSSSNSSSPSHHVTD